MELFWFWAMKGIAETIIDLAFIAAVVFAAALASAPKFYRQWRCRHDEVRETMACDAICCNCGKNLGFIGAWRKQKEI